MKSPFPALICLLLLFSCDRRQSGNPNQDLSPVVPAQAVNQTPASPEPKASNVLNYPKSVLLGKIQVQEDTGFARVPSEWTDKSGIYLRKECLSAFIRMAEQAKKDGFQLKILSAFRSFQDQKGIWENKWSGKTIVEGKNLAQSVPDPVLRAKTILRYSSMPGSSRHHWGTDLDINSLDPAWFNTAEGKKLYAWLQAHAPEFGFCQPYSEKGESRPQGYEEEKWHWSFLPLSQPMLKSYQDSVRYEDIRGFAGSETAKTIGIIEHYVLGISPLCK